MVDFENAEKIVWTKEGLKEVRIFIQECEAKRKEILDAYPDPYDDTHIPDIEAIESDIFCFYDEEEKAYCNGWGVTDNHDSDYPLCLEHGKHFVFN